MKKIKIAEAPNRAIDWLVAKAEGLEGKIGGSGTLYVVVNDIPCAYAPTTDPAQAWPIIEREKILLMANAHKSGEEPWVFDSWFADRFADKDKEESGCDGDTSLIAAMRCYAVSVYGEEAEVPEELLA